MTPKWLGVSAAALLLAGCGGGGDNPASPVNMTEPGNLIAPPENAAEAPLDEYGALTPNPTPTGRMVHCRITNDYGAKFDGQCLFQADSDGSFALSLPDEKPLTDEITLIGVGITAPGKAEVRGLTTAGVNSRWGAATRSTEDPACWTGEDFEICAW
tara:strand:+ start:1055 stop:1525 length:471 start_codon:yes stop_codon:yes gene_type:complete